MGARPGFEKEDKKKAPSAGKEAGRDWSRKSCAALKKREYFYSILEVGALVPLVSSPKALGASSSQKTNPADNQEQNGWGAASSSEIERSEHAQANEVKSAPEFCMN